MTLESKQVELTIQLDEENLKQRMGNMEKYTEAVDSFECAIFKAYKAQQPSPLDECLAEVTKLVSSHNWYGGFQLREILQKYISSDSGPQPKDSK